ncbi:MAG: SRPBCC family protein [Bacteroidota bacterium]
MNADTNTTSADCEIVSSRILDAPCESVFAAFTNPDILKRWWGPAGFTNTFKEFDLRPGGKWHYTMHGTDKGNYENEAVFKVVEKPNLIVWDRISKPLFRMSVVFEEVDSTRTKFTFRMQFDNQRDYEKMIGFVPAKNEENFDRLEAELQRVK